MKKSFRIEIPKPCHENWHEMIPNEQGAFCKSCQKTVVDFSQMTDNQFIKFVKNNPNGFCGRLKSRQLTQTFELPTEPKNTPTPMRWAAAGMIAASLLSHDAEAKISEKPTIEIVDNQALSLNFDEKIEGDSLRIIEGKVIDKNDKSPLPGVTVVVKGTKTGCNTDINGVFKIKVSENAILVFSYVGYQNQEFYVAQFIQNGNLLEMIELKDDFMGDIVVGGVVIVDNDDLYPHPAINKGKGFWNKRKPKKVNSDIKH